MKAEARERQLSELKQNKSTVRENLPAQETDRDLDDTEATAGLLGTVVGKLPQRTKARDELGAMAGVSGSTYEHATAILDNAPEPVKEAVRKQEISINAGYEATKLPPEKQTEIVTRIESGEKPKVPIDSGVEKQKSDTVMKKLRQITLRPN